MSTFDDDTHNSRLAHATGEMTALANERIFIPTKAGLQALIKALENNEQKTSPSERVEGNNLEIYLELVTQDLESMINFIGQLSAMATADGGSMDSALMDGTIKCRFDVSAFFSAAIEEQSSNAYKIQVSPTTLIAIDDFVLRSFCNADFFSADMDRIGRRWEGCTCYFSPRGEIFAKPKLRFLDYTTVGGATRMEPEGYPKEWHYYYPAFFTGAPIGEPSRLNCAALASYIAFTWIILHEAAHYRLAHFTKDAVSIVKRLFGRRIYRIDETASNVSNIEYSRAMEFQADMLAAQHVVDLFFNPMHIKSLPNYAAKDARWMARLIGVSIGLVTLLIEKARQRYGAVGHYPSPMARLVTTLYATNERVLAHLSNPVRIGKSKNESIARPKIEFDKHVRVGGFTDLFCAAEMLDETLNIPLSTGVVERDDNPAFLFPWSLKTGENELELATHDFLLNTGLLDIQLSGQFREIRDLKFATDAGRECFLELKEIVNQHHRLSAMTSDAREAIKNKHINPYRPVVAIW